MPENVYKYYNIIQFYIFYSFAATTEWLVKRTKEAQAYFKYQEVLLL